MQPGMKITKKKRKAKEQNPLITASTQWSISWQIISRNMSLTKRKAKKHCDRFQEVFAFQVILVDSPMLWSIFSHPIWSHHGRTPWEKSSRKRLNESKRLNTEERFKFEWTWHLRTKTHFPSFMEQHEEIHFAELNYNFIGSNLFTKFTEIYKVCKSV